MTLPYRFREQAVRRFEPVIRQLLLPFHQRELDTMGLSPETFTCRLRDAIKAQARFNHIPGLDVTPLEGVKLRVTVDGKVLAERKLSNVLYSPSPETLMPRLDELSLGRRDAVMVEGDLDLDWLDENYPNLAARRENNMWIIQ